MKISLTSSISIKKLKKKQEQNLKTAINIETKKKQIFFVIFSVNHLHTLGTQLETLKIKKSNENYPKKKRIQLVLNKIFL